MIIQVTAFRSNNGYLHDTAKQAFEYDLQQDIFKLFNSASQVGVMQLLAKKKELLEILTRTM